MRRRTFARDLAGTLAVFVMLLIFVALIIYGENLLDAFKSH